MRFGSLRQRKRGALAGAASGVAAVVGAALTARPAGAAAQRQVVGGFSLSGRYWELFGQDHRAGAVLHRGERLAGCGELLSSPDGEKVGEFYSTCIFVAAPFGAGPQAALTVEHHTFNLDGGTISGMGTTTADNPDGESVFAIVGGTGRFAGVTGSYVARQGFREMGGDGSADFTFTLVA